jgi:hypothetical protein
MNQTAAPFAARLNFSREKLPRSLAAACALIVLLLSGCRDQHLDTYYGQQQVPGMRASVNGTDVLASMFEQRGHHVRARRTLLTTQMAAVDTIVWFPDDYAAPSTELCDWFDSWLSEQPNRTLVYVARDFDAAPLYWQTVAPWVSADQATQYRKEQKAAELRATPPGAPKPESLDCAWFTLKPQPSRAVTVLAGPWSRGIAQGDAELSLGWRIEPHDPSTPLLSSNNDVLVARLQKPHWQQSQLLLVANGSFLLNLPLVNHQHRKLAGKLLDAVSPQGEVVFLVSGPGGPPIDPPPTDGSLWRVFGAWPLNVVLLHFAVLGVIFCFARWPIFGRPRALPDVSLSDFGKHVEAVGKLLARSRDQKYALEQIAMGDVTSPPPQAKPLQ